MTSTTISPSLAPSSTSLQTLKIQWKQQLNQLVALIAEGLLPPALEQEVTLLTQSIDGFKLSVPLVGKFSAGKSSLINAWLGQELQAIDLAPCTYHATEFHFSEHPCLVIHWQKADGSIRTERRAISDYETLKNGTLKPTGEELHLVEFHLNSPSLARFPEIILVDTPGISSHDSRHTEAVSNYLGEGVVFILCANESTLGQEELAFVQRQTSLGQTFYLLQCKQDLLAPGDRAAVLQALIGQAGINAAKARSCSAHEDKLTGLEDILSSIEAEKTQLFLRNFGPALQALLAQAQQLLRRQLAQDLSAEKIQEQQQALRNGMAAAQQSFEQESSDLYTDVRGPITRAIRTMTGDYLRSRVSSYAGQLLNAQDPSVLLSVDIRNAVQLAGEQHLSPRLIQSAQRIGAEIERATAVLDNTHIAVGAIKLDSAAANERDQGFSIGTILAMAPLVISKLPIFPIVKIVSMVLNLLTPLLGAFFKQKDQAENQRAQAESQIHNAINQALLQLDQQLPSALQEQSRGFLEKLRTQIDARLRTDEQSLNTLQAELEKTQQERNAKETRVKHALQALNELASAKG